VSPVVVEEKGGAVIVRQKLKPALNVCQGLVGEVTLWKGCLTPMVLPMSRLRKALPGRIALHAKLRLPIRDWSWRRVILRLELASWRGEMHFCSLSCGRESCLCTVSISIP